MLGTARMLPTEVKPAQASCGDVEMRMETVDLSAWYGISQALRNVNLPVAACSITAIVGPSGCGKSTLVRCLSRLHELQPGARVSGRVLLDGQDIYGPAADPVRVRRRIGMVFQKPNPFPHMSVYDNVAAGVRLAGRRTTAELDEIVERALRQAVLWDEVKDKLHVSGAALSGGQQQRLCIARALAVEPEVILMDEPASALDPIATMKLEEVILQLKKRYTVVIVTHNMQQAARISDFAAFILAGEDGVGELVEFGPTGRLFTQPSDRRTEDYITGRFG